MSTGSDFIRREVAKQNESGFWQQLSEFLNVSGTARFSIFGLVLLVVLVPISRFGLPSLLENGLLLDNFSQAILASFSWYVTAALLILQIRASWVHGSERFGSWNRLDGELSGPHPRNLAELMELSRQRGMGWPAWLYLSWVLLPMPSLTMVADLNLRVNTGTITAASLYGGFVIGGLLATFSLILLSFLRKYILPGVVPLRGIFPFESLHHKHDHLLDSPEEVAKLPKCFAVFMAKIGLVSGPGYSIKDPNGCERPLAGHMELALLMGMLVSLTFVLGIFEHFLFPGSNLSRVIPTIGHFALMVAILSTLFSGLAFWLDRFRISTFLAISLLGLSLFVVRDYEFVVEKTSEPSPTLVETIQAKDIPTSGSPDPRQRNQRTLIVVTAPGGGIHAAAWSAEVLTRLDERWPGTFRDSLGMISAVSGGSVGSMYYVDAISEKDHEVKMEAVRQRARQSCLEPIFFAANFHDLLPLTPFDRGTAAEHYWDLILRNPGETSPKLSRWGDQAKQGKLPVVVFNATDVKSGRRVLLGSAAIHGESHKHDADSHDEPTCDADCTALDLRHQRLDMNVATAVRLSASFPYVTPISRPALDAYGNEIMPPVRMGDGAYADNDGIMTALESISRLIDRFSKMSPEERSFDRILLINIDNYGSDPNEVKFKKSGGQLEALSYAILGPLLGLSNVRGASQQERGQLEVSFLRDRTVTEQEVMWVLRHFTNRRNLRDSSGRFDGKSDGDGDRSRFSLQAQKNAMNRLEHIGIAPEDAPATSTTSLDAPTHSFSHSDESSHPHVAASPGLYPIQFQVVNIPYSGDGEPPLSWKLSSDQMRTYQKAWSRLDHEAQAWVCQSDKSWEEADDIPPLKQIEMWLGPPGSKTTKWTIAGRRGALPESTTR